MWRNGRTSRTHASLRASISTHAMFGVCGNFGASYRFSVQPCPPPPRNARFHRRRSSWLSSLRRRRRSVRRPAECWPPPRSQAEAGLDTCCVVLPSVSPRPFHARRMGLWLVWSASSSLGRAACSRSTHGSPGSARMVQGIRCMCVLYPAGIHIESIGVILPCQSHDIIGFKAETRTPVGRRARNCLG